MSISVESSDGKVFTIDKDAANMSKTFKVMLESLDAGDSPTEEQKQEQEPIRTPTVTGEILQLVIEWLNEHKNDSAEKTAMLSAQSFILEIPEWDVNFLKVEKKTLFDIMLAANYLDVAGLLNICGKTIADMIKGKAPEEIREILQLPDDLSPERKEFLRKRAELFREALAVQ